MQKYWYQKQMRVLHTVLREIDIINYDAKAVVDYMKKTASNVLIVNAGGIVDFFHNETELAHHNPFMKEGQEILADVCEECHKNNFHVITRVDFRGVQKYRYEAQPDWFAANLDGSPKENPWWGGLYSPCYVGVYANNRAVRFIKELMTKFPIDGIWENSVAFQFQTGPCYCRSCRDQYKIDTGKEIPVDPDYNSPVLAEYRNWKSKKGDEHIIRIRDTVKSFGQDKAYSAEVFSMFHNSIASGIDVYAARHFDYTMQSSVDPGYARSYGNLNRAASTARFLKALDPKKNSVIIMNTNGHPWRLVKAPSQETRTRFWGAVGMGANFTSVTFHGIHPAAADDKRNAYIQSDIYHFLKDNEDQLHQQIPVGDIGIFYSQSSRNKAHLDKDNSYEIAIRGLEAVLIDSHIPYGFILDRDFSYEKACALKVLCLPNTMCLSDSHIEDIRKYVENGGSLMASYKTSLFDENGISRGNFGLMKVFGLSYTGIQKDTSIDCYQMVRLPSHKITDGMEADKTKFFINSGHTLLTTAIDREGEMICSYVPIIPNQYPEQAWIRLTKTEFPTVFCYKYGKGKVVFFPNQMDALYYTNGHEDFYHLVLNSLNYLCKKGWSLKTDAPDSVHGGLTKHIEDNRYILSFVNVSSAGNRAIKYLDNTRSFNASLQFSFKELVSFKTIYPSPADEIKHTSSIDNDGHLVLNLQIPPFKEFIAVAIEVK